MKPLVRALDVAAAACMALLILIRALARSLARRRPRHGAPRLIVVDNSHTLHGVRVQGNENAILCRDLDGFFEHVFTIHPLVGASRDEPIENGRGPLREVRLAPRHTVIEAPIARHPRLSKLPRLNFVLAQSALLRRLDALAREEGVNVVLIRDPYYQGLLGLYLRGVHGLPLVVRIGGNDDANYAATGRRNYPRLFPSRAAEKAVERRVLAGADLVAGANQDNLEAAIRNGARRDRTTLFRYGAVLDPAHFVPPEERPGVREVRQDIPLEGRRLLVFVGRLEPVKRAMDLVECLPDILAAHPDVGLVVIGDGSLAASMRSRARELQVEHAIALVGNRSQEWLAGFLPQGVAALSPHMGRALVECALAGLPAIAYDLDWQAELVREGQTGFLVPAGDVAGLAKQACRLLADPAEAERMGRAARELALDMMDPDRLKEHERAQYRRLLEGASR